MHKKKKKHKEFYTKKREGKGPMFFKNVSHEREKLDMLQIKGTKGNITTKYKTWLQTGPYSQRTLGQLATGI